MKKLLFLFLTILFAGCPKPDFDTLKEDTEAVNKVAQMKLFTLADGESFDEVKNDFSILTGEVDGVSLTWNSSDTSILSVSGSKVTVHRILQDQRAVLTLTLTKNAVAKTMKYSFVIPGIFSVPDIRELIKCPEGYSADNISQTFNYISDFSAWGNLYEGLSVEWSSGSKYLTLNEGQGTIDKEKYDSIPKNSSFAFRINAKFTSPLYTEAVEKYIGLRVAPELPTNSEIKDTITIYGKTLRLTYFDEFDDEAQWKEDWDIGNPGVKRNYGGGISTEGNHDNVDGVAENIDTTNFDFREVDYPEEKKFTDGFQGYHHDRYKQAYWSEKATKLKDGKLEIQVFWDSSVDNYEKKISGGGSFETNPGYGVSGAIHSKRMFPRGFFVTKLKVNKTHDSHWDAWWAESNNPYSNKYGYKKLFTPPENQNRENLKKPFNTRFSQFGGNKRAPKEGRGVNGQQVYEYDMYEEVYDNHTQYHVLHSWEWYGGHPGNTSGLNTSSNGLFWTQSLRANDRKPGWENGSENYNDQGNTKNKKWFYLVLCITGEDGNEGALIRMNMYDENGKEVSKRVRKFKDLYGKTDENFFHYNHWNLEQNPIQIKYSTEIGNWDNSHNLLYNSGLTPENPDVMYSDYFAFYAWDDTNRDEWYTSKFE